MFRQIPIADRGEIALRLDLGGAIDPGAADKASRFIQLCDAHGLPIVSLTDTPGFMVGPGVEAQAQVYENGQALNMAATLEIDSMIDPAATRDWLVRGLASATRAAGPRARFVDTW